MRGQRPPNGARLEKGTAPVEQAATGARRWLGEQARHRVGLLAAAGSGLLIASELTERLDRVEGAVGLGAVNLIFAVPIAALLVGVAALIGASLLDVIEQRLGRRLESRHLGALMITTGAAASGGIIFAHLRHPLALDSWLGICGGLLLLVAGTAHHQLTRGVSRRWRER